MDSQPSATPVQKSPVTKTVENESKLASITAATIISVRSTSTLPSIDSAQPRLPSAQNPYDSSGISAAVVSESTEQNQDYTDDSGSGDSLNCDDKDLRCESKDKRSNAEAFWFIFQRNCYHGTQIDRRQS